MTEAELVKSLSERFYSDFADTVARRVRDAGGVGLLYRWRPRRMLTCRSLRDTKRLSGAPMCSKRSISPLPMRSCPSPERSATGTSPLVRTGARSAISQRSWPTCWDVIRPIPLRWSGSPRRRRSGPPIPARSAVRIWAVEVLKHCRERVGWVAEAWDDLVETMAHGATPGIECRMRKSWKPGRSDKA